MPLAHASAPASASNCGVSIAWPNESISSARQQPVRLALAQERLDAFAAFVARADLGDVLDRALDQSVVDLLARDVLHQRLAGLDGRRAAGDERLRDVAHLRVE